MKAARARAEQLLTVAARKDADDATVLRSLGILAEMTGDRPRATQWYRAGAGGGAGELCGGDEPGYAAGAEWGSGGGGRRYGRRRLRNNQDVPELGQNLAVVECRLGDGPGAQAVLRTVLTYSPGVTAAREMLAAIGDGRQACGTSGLTMHSLQ